MIEEKLHAWMLKKKKTLVLAESCTGGHIAARLTKLQDASKYFLGSYVVYSERLKTQMLKISKKELKSFGAVSAEITLQMAERALKQAKADFALAVTGLAGPSRGGSIHPVGTIFAAVAGVEIPTEEWNFYLKGNRSQVIELATSEILTKFYKYLIR